MYIVYVYTVTWYDIRMMAGVTNGLACILLVVSPVLREPLPGFPAGFSSVAHPHPCLQKYSGPYYSVMDVIMQQMVPEEFCQFLSIHIPHSL